MTEPLIDERALSKLKWRCRRGLLENDIFIERFFSKYQACLNQRQAQALSVLMDLSDNDLLDLNLGRQTLAQIDPNLDREDVFEVLCMLRQNAKR